MPPTRARRQQLALALHRLARSLRGEPEPELPAEIALPLTAWQTDMEARVDVLEAGHDSATRRQTLLILFTLAADLALEIVKRNR